MNWSKSKGLLWLAIVIALGAATAVGLPRLARHVPWWVENRLAPISSPLEFIRCEPKAQHLIAFQKLKDRIFPVLVDDTSIPLSIEVIRGEMVNAFATLGGHIFVFEGLIKKATSPEEVAGVLAHEIEHVRHRHIIQSMISQWIAGGFVHPLATTLLHLRFSRNQESEADEDGMIRLQKVKVNLKGYARFFDRMASQELDGGLSPGFLSDHPSSVERSKKISDAIENTKNDATLPILSHSDWLAFQQICNDSKN